MFAALRIFFTVEAPFSQYADQSRLLRYGSKRLNDLSRCLHQLNQHALASYREFVIRLGVHEANVVPRSPFAYAARGKTHTLPGQPFNRFG